MGRYEDVLKEANIVINQDRTNPEAHYFKGLVYFIISDWKNSLQNFESVVMNNSSHPAHQASALVYSGYCFLELKSYESALVVFAEALHMNSRSSIANRFVEK